MLIIFNLQQFIFNELIKRLSETYGNSGT